MNTQLNQSVAIIGLACEFPGSNSPEALWDTVLHQRRWFRNIPPERVSAEYIDPLGERLDTTRLRRAALLEGYMLPLNKFSLGENDLRTADYTHWLALDCATRAIEDAGLGSRLPRESTRVIVGNSLTGESSRADLLRLRWPYVRKTLEESGCHATESDWKNREKHFKARLAEVKGRSLAGALSNVIAGRIAQQHDLKGGCYCVDAACASSLVAVAHACSQLITGEAECILVGGVDVSLDPLELVGFSEAGALCVGEMKIFDEKRCGFIPGEGCGFAVLMRADHPALKSIRVRAFLRGWAISSDGAHDLVAPSPDGQRLVLERAYQKAGFGIETVPFFEAHGTGTQIGDKVEIATLLAARNGAVRPATVGSIKANIGHTKAAAGMAGLIKAVSALEARIIPPTTGCFEPMLELRGSRSLQISTEPVAWPQETKFRVGVSGFGFGGINAHVVLEGWESTSPMSSIAVTLPKRYLQPRESSLFVFDDDNHDGIVRKIDALLVYASSLADTQFAAAAKATAKASGQCSLRAAVVAQDPDDLELLLRQLRDCISRRVPVEDNIFFSGAAPVEQAREQLCEEATDLSVAAMHFVRGGSLNIEAIFGGSEVPCFDLRWNPVFFCNPCEHPLETDLGETVVVPQSSKRPESALEAVQLALKRHKGTEFEMTLEGSQTLASLGVDSLGLLDLTAEIENYGFIARGQPRNLMPLSQFATLFEASSRSQTRGSLSDLLIPWVRLFAVNWEQSSLELSTVPDGTDQWRIVSNSALPQGFTSLAGAPRSSLLIHCDAEIDDSFLELMLTALRDVAPGTLVLFLDSTGQLPGFAKTFAIENPDARVLVVDYQDGTLPGADLLSQEVVSLSSFREVRYDAHCTRFLPCWRLARTRESQTLQISPKDVILVTGGAKGITAECMLALAEVTAAKFAIVGRSASEDGAVKKIRHKLSAMGIDHDYWSLDIGDASAVSLLVPTIEREFGPIRGIIHGAAVQKLCTIKELRAFAIEHHCRAKVEGLRNLLAKIPADQIKFVAAFGSVIARSGYRGSAAYALANDRMATLLTRYQKQHPAVRCRVIDWSAWRETGMAANLQAIDRLKTDGVDPLNTEAGTSTFLNILRQSEQSSRIIVAGRLPEVPTVSFGHPIPKPKISRGTVLSFTPEVEVVAEIHVSLEAEPWLAGHSSRDGNVILPGMLILQLMQSVASTLTNFPKELDAQLVEFRHPVSFAPLETCTLLLQAVFEPDGVIICRAGTRNNSLAEYAAVARFNSCDPQVENKPKALESFAHPAELGRSLAQNVYDHLLFHRKDFQQIDRYQSASATETVFHLKRANFNGDPLRNAVLNRDTFIHGIQICVPGELLLPAKIGRITSFKQAATAVAVYAHETHAKDGTFVFQVTAFDESGELVEQWQDLLLKRYADFKETDQLHPEVQAIHRLRKEGNQPARFFEYRHIVGFKETNLTGNVYFTNHIEWQGRCREFFLRKHAPTILQEVQSGQLALVTVSCSCDYLAELQPFDELSIRLTLEAQGHDWVSMRFEYWRESPGKARLIAVGRQKIASRCAREHGLLAVAMPKSLVSALQRFDE